MKVALFVPCYVDQLFPQVAWASIEVLEALGCQTRFDPGQACCGQALLNAGDPEGARKLARQFLELAERDEHWVAPSASCVATMRRHYPHLLGDDAASLTGRVHELCEFVVDGLGVERLEGRYPRRVGLHPSCHGLRELGLGSGSERAIESRDPARELLSSLRDLELVEPERSDECCGFGGSFSVGESAVSGMMGRDRLRALQAAGAEVVTATDVSCLAHLDGIGRRRGDGPEVRHVAEILAGALA